MKNSSRYALILTFIFALVACGEPESGEGRKVDASGKEATDLDALPAEVVAAAKASQPDLSLSEAEYETRDGNEYYDVGGTLPDGSELELDMTKIDGIWTVVETQRDIDLQMVPAAVGDTLRSKFSDWNPSRIIESDQGDGVIVYEFFGKDDAGRDTKIEIKLEGGQAQLLLDEWAH